MKRRQQASRVKLGPRWRAAFGLVGVAGARDLTASPCLSKLTSRMKVMLR
jgi:hypothetical protein